MASLLTSTAGAIAKLGYVTLSPFFSGPLLLAACFPDTARDAVAFVTGRLPVDITASLPTNITPFLSYQTATLVLCALFARVTIAWLNRSLNTMASNAWRVGRGKGWCWTNEIAVVTGGSSGIGKAIVERLTALGVRVAIFDVQGLPADLQDNPCVRFYQCDVISSDSIAVAADAVRRELGHPSILVNNAGIAQPGPILKTDETFLRRILGVNLMSMWFTTQQFLPNMIESNKGHVVTMASLASFIALATAADYSATKAGALSFHESLTAEIKHIHKAPGILTTVVHPNFARTPLTADISDRLERSGVQLLSSEQIADELVGQIEGRRGGQLIIPRSATLVSSIRGWPTWMQELLRDAIARGSVG
jgi:all-trans-retinol dehydrogenase (NAD+)